MRHVIKTQVLDLVTNSTDEAFGLQQSLSHFFYSSILPVLEKTFDKVAPADRMISLDRLELDLGDLTMKDIQKEDWAKLLMAKLERELKDNLQLEQSRHLPVDTGIAVSQQWIYYMERGYLPWNAIETDNAWFNHVLEGFASDSKAIERLRQLIGENPKAVSRIVRVHDPAFLAHLVEVLTTRKQTRLAKVISGIHHLLERKATINISSAQENGRKTWVQVLSWAAGNSNSAEEEVIEKAVFASLTLTDLQQLQDKIANRNELKMYKQVLVAELKKRSLMETPKQEQPASPVEKVEKPLLPGEGLFIGHAGIVLLHPFLQRFFQYTSLWNGVQFTNRFSQQKAMVLLYWMVAGNCDPQEHELVIHKILCGYPVNDPVEPGISVTQDDKEIAAGLLEAVIAEWTILKNTSRQGLAEQFLARNGKLICKDDDLRLQVESNTVDVLLDHLPWGIGTIKLPWMPRMLKVEWR